MATLTRGQTFLPNDTVTATKLHNLVDAATLSAIVNADIDDSAAIVDTKLATIATAGKVSATSFVDLASIPAGAGVIPSANLGASIPVKATGAEINTGTDDAKFATPKALKDQVVLAKYSDVRFKVGTFTRDMTAGSGDVAYTGIGFTPKAIIFMAGKDTPSGITNFISIGDGTSRNVLASFNYSAAGVAQLETTLDLYLVESGTQIQSAVIKTMDADGFTLTWSKGGTPSAGTVKISYIALR